VCVCLRVCVSVCLCVRECVRVACVCLCNYANIAERKSSTQSLTENVQEEYIGMSDNMSTSAFWFLPAKLCFVNDYKFG